jgi:hypothetical protein
VVRDGFRFGMCQTHFQHLDKRHAQVKIRKIAADQAQAKHHADRYNGPPLWRAVSFSVERHVSVAFLGHSHVGTLCRESNVVVNRAISCVMIVANSRCHVVKNNTRESQSSLSTGSSGRTHEILM